MPRQPRDTENFLPREVIAAIESLHHEEFASRESAEVGAEQLNCIYAQAGITSLLASAQWGNFVKPKRGQKAPPFTPAWRVVSRSTMEHFDAAILLDKI